MNQQSEPNTTEVAVARQILEKISRMRNLPATGSESTSERVADGLAHHLARILAFVRRGEPVQMVLPAFPAKSANREKTLGSLPDLGEVLALERLNALCEELREVHAPGARIVLCSDGRVFSDLVGVTDEDVTAYGREIRRIISERGLKNLSTYDLDDLFGEATHDQTRQVLTERYGDPLEVVRARAESDPDARSLYNGIHRFLFEDHVVLSPELSRSKVRQWSGKLAYATIQRSNAWSNLVAEKFPEAVRLSIHPQPLHARKIGIQLVESDNRWRTPWHSVALFDGTSFRLVRRRDAEELGAVQTLDATGRAYFVMPSVTAGGENDGASVRR